MKLSLALALSLTLLACVSGLSFAAWLGCYALALVFVSLPLTQHALRSLAPRAAWALVVLLAAPGAVWLGRQWHVIADAEGLIGLDAYVLDRARLQAEPSIAPPLIAADRPQRFYVSAGGGRDARVRLGSSARELRAVRLGAGLFRVDYDPRRDGPPQPANGALQATITVDGRATLRQLTAATPAAHPRWLTTSPDRTLAATVSEESDELIVVSSAGVVARIAVEDGPIDCAFVGAQELAVSYRDHDRLDVFSVTSGQRVRSFALGSRQGRIALAPSGTLLAVGLVGEPPAVALVDLKAGRVRERITLADAPDWLAFGVDDATLIYSSLADAALHRLRRGGSGVGEDAKLSLGRPVVTLARTAVGRQLVVATTGFSQDGKPQLGNHFVEDQLLFVDAETLRVVRRERTARRSERQSKPGDVDRGLSPMGIAEGRGAELLVAFAGSDEVFRARPEGVDPDVVDLADTDLHAPHGVAALADGTLVITSPAYGAIGLLPASSPTPRVLHLAHDDAYLLAHDRDALQRRVGERGFYEGTRSGISCQSCHMHADSDDAGYNLGEHRLVPTLSVRGLLGTAPYLRDGTYPRIRDLDEVAQTLYRGYLRRQGARGETLEAFVSSLPRRELPVTAAADDVAAEQRGYSVFVKAGCPTCHAPPAFTNLGMLPMATLFPDEAARLAQPDPEMLDTPSLLSIGASAPYLNDGRAKTLEALLTKYNAKNRHGDTRALKPNERADLITFLRSL